MMIWVCQTVSKNKNLCIMLSSSNAKKFLHWFLITVGSLVGLDALQIFEDMLSNIGYISMKQMMQVEW